MIPEIYIEEWRANAPWVTLSMVEQDMVISRALVALYNEPHIGSTLAFRGGTALNKLFIQPPARYSEDIDFVQIKSAPIGGTIDAVRQALDPWLGEPKRKLTDRSAKLIYRYTAIDNVVAKLKIEINTTEHFHVLPLTKHSFKMKSEWFEGESTILCYHLDELMGTKLRALYQRRKGRDLFDLWFVLKEKLIDVKNVVSIFEKYAEYNNEPVTRALFEKNLYLKKTNQDFQSDMSALLPADSTWDFESALKMVEDAFIPKLTGAAWKRE